MQIFDVKTGSNTKTVFERIIKGQKIITSIDKTHFNESLYKRNSAIQQPFEFSLLFLWDNPLWGSNIRT